MKAAASYLLWLGVIAIVLTYVQPMHPEVDKMFRIGGGIVIIVCLGILRGSRAPEQSSRERSSSSDSEK